MDWSVGQFGDARLDNGGAAILEQMVMRKTVCLKRLGGARDGEERIGRFFGNDSVTGDKIIDIRRKADQRHRNRDGKDRLSRWRKNGQCL